MVKNLLANAGDTRGSRFDPWVGKVPWRRTRHSTPVLLPGKSHGQRGLVGYSPRGHKESDTTERLTLLPKEQRVSKGDREGIAKGRIKRGRRRKHQGKYFK